MTDPRRPPTPEAPPRKPVPDPVQQPKPEIPTNPSPTEIPPVTPQPQQNPTPEAPPSTPIPQPPITDRITPELGGYDGAEPTRFGDWEHNGRCTDF